MLILNLNYIYSYKDNTSLIEQTTIVQDTWYFTAFACEASAHETFPIYYSQNVNVLFVLQ